MQESQPPAFLTQIKQQQESIIIDTQNSILCDQKQKQFFKIFHIKTEFIQGIKLDRHCLLSYSKQNKDNLQSTMGNTRTLTMSKLEPLFKSPSQHSSRLVSQSKTSSFDFTEYEASNIFFSQFQFPLTTQKTNSYVVFENNIFNFLYFEKIENQDTCYDCCMMRQLKHELSTFKIMLHENLNEFSGQVMIMLKQPQQNSYEILKTCLYDMIQRKNKTNQVVKLVNSQKDQLQECSPYLKRLQAMHFVESSLNYLYGTSSIDQLLKGLYQDQCNQCEFDDYQPIDDQIESNNEKQEPQKQEQQQQQQTTTSKIYEKPQKSLKSDTKYDFENKESIQKAKPQLAVDISNFPPPSQYDAFPNISKDTKDFYSENLKIYSEKYKIILTQRQKVKKTINLKEKIKQNQQLKTLYADFQKYIIQDYQKSLDFMQIHQNTVKILNTNQHSNKVYDKDPSDAHEVPILSFAAKLKLTNEQLLDAYGTDFCIDDANTGKAKIDAVKQARISAIEKKQKINDDATLLYYQQTAAMFKGSIFKFKYNKNLQLILLQKEKAAESKQNLQNTKAMKLLEKLEAAKQIMYHSTLQCDLLESQKVINQEDKATDKYGKYQDGAIINKDQKRVSLVKQARLDKLKLLKQQFDQKIMNYANTTAFAYKAMQTISINKVKPQAKPKLEQNGELKISQQAEIQKSQSQSVQPKTQDKFSLVNEIQVQSRQSQLQKLLTDSQKEINKKDFYFEKQNQPTISQQILKQSVEDAVKANKENKKNYQQSLNDLPKDEKSKWTGYNLLKIAADDEKQKQNNALNVYFLLENKTVSEYFSLLKDKKQQQILMEKKLENENQEKGESKKVGK